MIQRGVIDQAIDRLPDNLLLELIRFIQTLLEKIQPHLPLAFERNLPTPEEVVAKIQQLPPNPATFRPATGSLAEALTRPRQAEAEPFNVQVWNETWDKIEAELKTEALMHEEMKRLETWLNIS